MQEFYFVCGEGVIMIYEVYDESNPSYLGRGIFPLKVTEMSILLKESQNTYPHFGGQNYICRQMVVTFS